MVGIFIREVGGLFYVVFFFFSVTFRFLVRIGRVLGGFIRSEEIFTFFVFIDYF